jgi:hypothetical protein
VNALARRARFLSSQASRAWARHTGKAITLEIANTGRLDARLDDFAAIVEEELPAFAHRIIVYYEGHNDFEPSFLTFPDGGWRPHGVSGSPGIGWRPTRPWRVA